MASLGCRIAVRHDHGEPCSVVHPPVAFGDSPGGACGVTMRTIAASGHVTEDRLFPCFFFLR